MNTHNLLMKYKDLCMKYPSHKDSLYQVVNEVLLQIDSEGETPNIIQDGIKKLEKIPKTT